METCICVAAMCAAQGKGAYGFFSLCCMRKKERSGKDDIYSSKHSSLKKMQETDAFGQSAGLEIQTQVGTPSFLTPLTLIGKISSEEYLVPSPL